MLGVQLDEFNRLESSLLEYLEFKCHISSDDYMHFTNLFFTYAENNGLITEEQRTRAIEQVSRWVQSRENQF